MAEGLTKPRYSHACDACIYLGRYRPPKRTIDDRPRQHDLYYCPRSEFGGSVLARFGNDGGEYASMALELIQGVNLGPDHVLTHAARAAIRFLFTAYNEREAVRHGSRP